MKNQKKALVLEYFTVGYNIIEAAVSIAAGGFSGSISLVGFGMDSILESLSGMVLIWRLRKHGMSSSEDEEAIERRAVRFVGVTFIVLAIYIAIESGKKIYFAESASPSLPGIAIALISLVVMPILAYKKHQLGIRMGMKSLEADAKETLVCAFLSFALLLGLLLNYLFGLWIADPIVGLIIVGFLGREGYELLFEEDEARDNR